MLVECEIGDQALQARVLLLELPQAPEFAHPEVRVALLPDVERRLAHAELPTDIPDWGAALRLPQGLGDLLPRELRPLHRRAFWLWWTTSSAKLLWFHPVVDFRVDVKSRGRVRGPLTDVVRSCVYVPAGEVRESGAIDDLARDTDGPVGTREEGVDRVDVEARGVGRDLVRPAPRLPSKWCQEGVHVNGTRHRWRESWRRRSGCRRQWGARWVNRCVSYACWIMRSLSPVPTLRGRSCSPPIGGRLPPASAISQLQCARVSIEDLA